MTRRVVSRLAAGLLCLGCAPTAASAERGTAPERPSVGVKIYDPVPDTAALFREWDRLGIDTAFVSTKLAEAGSFIPTAREAGVRVFVITPVFFNPEHLAAHPEDHAITGRGERARQDWVEFVCPSREEYRYDRARDILSLLETHRPDGLSLDFIRHFVFWEMVGPEARIEELDTTCFCPHCLARFEADTGVRLPEASRTSTRAAADWLFQNHSESWRRWRAGLITSWVEDLARQARELSPGVLLILHLIPWSEQDYEDGLLRVAGQDVTALAPLVDYVSPMCYAHMLHREPDWVGDVVRDLAERIETPVLPSIEVKESYREERLTEAFFETALRAALAPPSRGVVFWSWPALAGEGPKQDILARLGR